jgi:hypothetical protein
MQGAGELMPNWTGDVSLEEQDRQFVDALRRDEPRLRSFIRKRVLDMEDATATMSLSELLYWVLFGDGRVEPVREMQS